ncbi:MAG TPA: hypothetical protein VJ761_19790 [Ktedonobacteraceae bacterium]|nr:hypothetical protein [Ktedonobacteraceae bacterium]
MQYMDYKEARELLIRSGFSSVEIARLTRLRREYLQKRLEQHDVPIHARQSRLLQWFMQVIGRANSR